MDIANCHNQAEQPQARDEATPGVYDWLEQKFGGRQRDLVNALPLKQPTIAKWKSRGVSMDSAVMIAEAAAARGIDISLEELVARIAAERRRRGGQTS